MQQPTVVIIGGGLTGLTLKHLLNGLNVKSIIIEARERLGGRIHTFYKEGSPTIEMGATWFSDKHQNLNQLLKMLELDRFPQVYGKTAFYESSNLYPFQVVQLPQNGEVSYRIKGGSSKLIQALASQMNAEEIHLGELVKSIEELDNQLVVKTNKAVYQTSFVVSTIPPYLLQNSINFQPQLPEQLAKVMQQTHTWMGESIKFGLAYASPFWKENNKSGTVYSNIGPITEMYDHSHPEKELYALKGFINGRLYHLKREERLKLIINQLKKYYGNDVEDYIDYQETVWSKEAFTYVPYENHIQPHQNNGHSIYQYSYMNGKLFIGGTETASAFPGYMDGAVNSAVFCFQRLKDVLS